MVVVVVLSWWVSECAAKAAKLSNDAAAAKQEPINMVDRPTWSIYFADKMFPGKLAMANNNALV